LLLELSAFQLCPMFFVITFLVIDLSMIGPTNQTNYCILLHYKITIFTIDQEKANAKASSSTAIRRFERIEWT
jgi:hypothetical protein